MFEFIYNQLLFYIAIILVLFLPGYFLLLALFRKTKSFSALEKFVISFGLSIISIDFLMLLLGKSGIAITRLSVLSAILVFILICRAVKYALDSSRKTPESVSEEKIDAQFSFSKNQAVLIILLLFLTIFIKTAYLADSIFPTATDLGHHMYWSKLISQTGEIPVYQEKDIIEVGGKYEISQPQKIADFIVGEHLIFSAVNLISGKDFISAFPSLILFLVNIMGILAMFVLALRLFENYPYGKNAAILALFLLGPLYAISSPQVKFVSGGVVGNIIGNFFIPLALYFYFRAFQEKKPIFLSTALLVTAGLFYTHHLSSFIFIFIAVFALAIFLFFNIKNIFSYLQSWRKIILSPSVIIVLAAIFIFLFFIYTPSYIETKAVETAVGGPSKSTRAGLTFTQLKFTVGEARMALGLFGLLLLFFNKKRKSYPHAFLAGWLVSLFAMSLKPQWLYLDLPSGRIANYLSYPLAIAGAFALAWLFHKAKNSESKNYYLNPKIFFGFCVLIFSFIAASGFYDNSQSLVKNDNSLPALQTFHAAGYLAKKTESTDVVLKDHNYIVADSWIKLFFMRDYNFPLSRGFFKRYEDTAKEREKCTFWMISAPNMAEGKKCFADTGVNFVMVNPKFDGPQFIKSGNFWQIYSNEEISIYYKNL